ncbi:epimerase [Bacillus sp. M6-12]|uniref:NAD-dependent epimerase/dehydratase family protein n=1 Tax=Bacillus sp. M6-12 TaxID=2054166 RepID=UPI000C771A0C|nr:NAD-dependent epimerase/dehydratase family protein [Bacillus sp. M6-12]PLS16196.1 epimerase [Bacillus sp. M6-12]
MKILVTGATGFLGSHLTRALVKEGYDVILLKRSYSNTWRISDLLQKVTFFDIDRCPIIQPFIECGHIDVIIHTATKYNRHGDRISELVESNISFPLELLETAIAFQTGTFINTDSFIHKGNTGYSHLAGYALTKKLFLECGKEYSNAKKIHFINARLEHLYGSFDGEDKFSSYILKSCFNNIPELQLTAGEQKRDFIHVRDAISAYLFLLKWGDQHVPWFKEFEVGTGSSVPVREFVELIHQKTRSSTTLKFGAIPYQENEIMDSKANIQQLQKLGWKSEIGLAQGIDIILADQFNINL